MTRKCGNRKKATSDKKRGRYNLVLRRIPSRSLYLFKIKKRGGLSNLSSCISPSTSYTFDDTSFPRTLYAASSSNFSEHRRECYRTMGSLRPRRVVKRNNPHRKGNWSKKYRNRKYVGKGMKGKLQRIRVRYSYIPQDSGKFVQRKFYTVRRNGDVKKNRKILQSVARKQRYNMPSKKILRARRANKRRRRNNYRMQTNIIKTRKRVKRKNNLKSQKNIDIFNQPSTSTANQDVSVEMILEPRSRLRYTTSDEVQMIQTPTIVINPVSIMMSATTDNFENTTLNFEPPNNRCTLADSAIGYDRELLLQSRHTSPPNTPLLSPSTEEIPKSRIFDESTSQHSTNEHIVKNESIPILPQDTHTPTNIKSHVEPILETYRSCTPALNEYNKNTSFKQESNAMCLCAESPTVGTDVTIKKEKTVSVPLNNVPIQSAVTNYAYTKETVKQEILPESSLRPDTRAYVSKRKFENVSTEVTVKTEGSSDQQCCDHMKLDKEASRSESYPSAVTFKQEPTTDSSNTCSSPVPVTLIKAEPTSSLTQEDCSRHLLPNEELSPMSIKKKPKSIFIKQEKNTKSIHRYSFPYEQLYFSPNSEAEIKKPQQLPYMLRSTVLPCHMPDGYLRLRIRNDEGFDQIFIFHEEWQMVLLKLSYSSKFHFPMENILLKFENVEIEDSSTPIGLKIRDGDMIEAHVTPDTSRLMKKI